MPGRLGSPSTITAYANVTLPRPKSAPMHNEKEAARPTVRLTDLTSSNLIVHAPMTSSNYDVSEILEKKRSLMSPLVEEKKSE